MENIKPSKSIEKIEIKKPMPKKLSPAETKALEEEALVYYITSDFFKKKIKIGFSGHRNHRDIIGVAKSVGIYYLKPNKEKIEYVVTGGATGWDLAILEQCFRYDIPYKIFLAFEEQKKAIRQPILDKALEVTWEKNKYITKKDKTHYMRRNKKIVNDVDELHVYLAKQDNKTINTIDYLMTTKKNKRKYVFNWHSLSFINILEADKEDKDAQKLLLGYRLYHFGKLMDRMKRNRKV